VDAEHAVSLRPDWAKAHARLAAACMGAREYSEAVRCYEQSVRLLPASKEYAAGLMAAKVGGPYATEARLRTLDLYGVTSTHS
jgi:cytochrome c-type biogenesis protein CcmH/NrfG